MTTRRLQTDAAIALAIGLAAVLALAFVAHEVLGLSALYPLTSAAAFASVAMVVSRTVAAHHPFDRFGAANWITTLRAVPVALVVGLVAETPGPAVAATAAGAGAVAATLDGIDGWLARRTAMATPFGARFDMEIDAVLILALAILAWTLGKAGAWVVASGLLRYFLVAAARPWPWLARPLPRSRRRQTICVVQVVGLIVAVSPLAEPWLSTPVAGAALLALCGSFLTDTLWLWRATAGAAATELSPSPSWP